MPHSGARGSLGGADETILPRIPRLGTTYARRGVDSSEPPGAGRAREENPLILTYVLILVACLVLSAFFSSSETALLRVRERDLDEAEEAGKGPSIAAVRSLLSSTSRLLVTILLGNNVANILGASVAAALAIDLFGPERGIPIATAAMTVVILLACEIFPKALAASHPLGVSRFVALPLYLFHQLLRPLHGLIDRIVDPAIRRMTGGNGIGEDVLSAEEVLRLALAARDGAEGMPMAIIGATSEAAEMTVSEIMVPRTEISAFPIETPAPELLEELLEDRYTRVPIYSQSIDDVKGVIHLKDLIVHVRSGEEDLGSILKPVIRVPERKRILDLLADMQRGFIHMAIVKDEFAVTQGLVTQEDILEEIVGEIRDEFDSEELYDVRERDDGSYDVLARVSVLDFNRASGWEINAERGDTLGGLLFNTLERAPRRGEAVELSEYELQCLDVSGARVTRVRVRRRAEKTAVEE